MRTLPATDRLLESWLQCERRAWLETHRSALATPVGGLEPYLEEQRRDLRRLYLERLRASHGASDVVSGAERDGKEVTAGALLRGAACVVGATFETTFQASSGALRLRVGIDGLRAGPRGWRLEALAAGGRVRPHHTRRLAFAHYVAAAAGVHAQRAAVVHVTREADRPSPGLVATDVSAAVRSARSRLPTRLEAVAASLRAGTEPRTRIGSHCRTPRDCPFRGHCWRGHRSYSIFQVPTLRTSTRRALRSAGWLDARHVPPEVPGLSPEEHQALQDAREAHSRVDIASLHRGLDQLEPPIAFLDMEFATPAVPWIPRMAAFEPLPFQFSVHLEGADGELAQRGYLHRGAPLDPRPPLAAALLSALRGTGTIVVYDAAGERLLLRALASAVPELAADLEAARGRIWDLLSLVRATVRHPGFGNGWGLKRVAATLAPDAYQGVTLADGLAAQATWRRLLRTRDPHVAGELVAYCAADSRAMVAIVRVLRRWVAGSRSGEMAARS